MKFRNLCSLFIGNYIDNKYLVEIIFISKINYYYKYTI